MIFENDFNNLSDGEIELLNSYFDGYDYQSSSYTLMANYIWRKPYKLSWQVIGEYLCIGGLEELEDKSEKHFMAFPLTKNGKYDAEKVRETLEEARKIFAEKGQALELSLVPKSLIGVLKEATEGKINIEHNRDDDDYIYLKEDLVKLGGRKLHQKKNHLNYFLRNYDFVYEEATPEMIPEIMEYIISKNEYKLGETPEEWKEILELETEAIKDLLTFMGKGLLTGIIRIDGKIEAVTIGEFARCDKKTAIVHVEKADDRIRGLYQAINNEFCKRLPEETIYVNREEDMGMENLRKTKMSYKPFMLSEKYTVTFK